MQQNSKHCLWADVCVCVCERVGVLPPHQKQIVTKTTWPQMLLSADAETDTEDSLSYDDTE